MCMCKHAHFYRSASAAGWLTPNHVSTTPSTPLPTVTDNLTILMMKKAARTIYYDDTSPSSGNVVWTWHFVVYANHRVTHLSIHSYAVIIILILTTMFTVLSFITVRPLQEFTRFIWRMQTERQIVANTQTKPTEVACESANRLLSSTSTITIYSHYSAQKMTLILSSHGERKAELT